MTFSYMNVNGRSLSLFTGKNQFVYFFCLSIRCLRTLKLSETRCGGGQIQKMS